MSDPLKPLAAPLVGDSTPETPVAKRPPPVKTKARHPISSYFVVPWLDIGRRISASFYNGFSVFAGRLSSRKPK